LVKKLAELSRDILIRQHLGLHLVYNYTPNGIFLNLIQLINVEFTVVYSLYQICKSTFSLDFIINHLSLSNISILELLLKYKHMSLTYFL